MFFQIGATVVATIAARKALTTSWKVATGKEPPQNPADPDVSIGEAIAEKTALGASFVGAVLLALVSILDREGRTIAETFVMADCGTGCRGDFSATVEYDVSRAQWGTLRVWDASARDGSPENVREYPVWLTPAD